MKNEVKGVRILNFDVYSATIGITIAILFQFIALIFHVKMHKKEQFIMWWFLGMGLSVVGLLAIYLRTFPSLNRGALIVSNALTIFGQGAFFIAIESYLNKNIKVNRLKTILATGIIVLIYFSVFSEITVLRMLTTSIVLLVFSVLIVRRLYLSKSDDNKDNMNFMIATFSINAFYWITRAAIVIFILPTHPEIYDIILIFSYIMVLLVCTLGTLGLILLINKNLVERRKRAFEGRKRKT